MSDPVLRLGGVGVRRSGRWILSSIDWTVSAGERWVVVGPNGAGKTTLLAIAATYLWPSAGTVEVLGERIGRVDEGWVGAIARVADHDVDRVAGRWIDLLDEEFGSLSREDKPWIRQLAADLVAFARSADRAPDVLFAWSL